MDLEFHSRKPRIGAEPLHIRLGVGGGGAHLPVDPFLGDVDPARDVAPLEKLFVLGDFRGRIVDRGKDVVG